MESCERRLIFEMFFFLGVLKQRIKTILDAIFSRTEELLDALNLSKFSKSRNCNLTFLNEECFETIERFQRGGNQKYGSKVASESSN